MGDKENRDPIQQQEDLLDRAEAIADLVRSVGIKIDLGILPFDSLEPFFKTAGETLATTMSEEFGEEFVNEGLQQWLRVIHMNGGKRGPQMAEAIEKAFLETISRKRNSTN